MAHDVFISHSSQDKPVADAACAALENVAIRCWIAPRDVQPGRTFAGEINRAIQRSKVMVLIFSEHSNQSEQVLREVQLASNSHLHIVQFRIQDVVPNDDLEYYLSAPHWLDALSPPLENHLNRLTGSVRALLEMDDNKLNASPAVPAAEIQGSVSAPSAGEQKSRRLQPKETTQRNRPNRWMPIFVGAVVLCAILLGLLLFQLGKRSNTEVQRQAPFAATSIPTASARVTATPTVTLAQRPLQSPLSQEPQAPKKPTLIRGVPLFSHNFETASPIIRPLFGAAVMSVRNAEGEGEITGKSPGILPAMFDKFLLDDFMVECDMRADDVPPGARYGFIFRAADVRNGGIARYYAMMLDPNRSTVTMSWWMDMKWLMNEERSVPVELLRVGRKSRLAVEASGDRFRAFVNDQFAAEFHADGLKIGRIGLVLSGASAQPWTVYFDNFEIFLPPKAGVQSGPTTTDHPFVAGKPFQRSWDFSAGMLADIRSEGVEVVDAKIWNLPGGKHVRFLTGGLSWLEATFTVPDGAELPTRLTVRHLSSSPDGNRPGFSPVRIRLNDKEIFRGSPAQKGWMDEQIDLGDSARPGINTLRWDYLNGAQTHYWLKSFRVSGATG